MAGYLTVTDEWKLTPAGVDVVGKDFPRRSEVNPAVFPAHSGAATKAHAWSPPFYNTDAPDVSSLRGGIAAAQYAGTDYHIVMIGDSKTRGSGVGSGESYLYGYPATLRRMLGAVEGLIVAEDPAQLADSRWTVEGLQLNTDPQFPGVMPISGHSGQYRVTFTSDFTHTGGTFWVNATTGATLTVTVDGGAPQTLTVASGNGFKAVTPTVTGTTAHTYTITSPNPIHVATFAPTYSGPRLKVSTVGRGSSTPSQWAPGFNTAGVGLWDAMLTTTPSAVLCGVGTNAPSGNGVPAVFAALAALNIPVIAIAPGGLGGTGALNPITTYIPMYAALWAAADLHDFPLVDFESVIGDFPTANAAGLLSDQVHENRRGYAYEAAALRTLLT